MTTKNWNDKVSTKRWIIKNYQIAFIMLLLNFVYTFWLLILSWFFYIFICPVYSFCDLGHFCFYFYWHNWKFKNNSTIFDGLHDKRYFFLFIQINYKTHLRLESGCVQLPNWYQLALSFYLPFVSPKFGIFDFVPKEDSET